MNKEASSTEQELAISSSNDRICNDAQPSLDPDYIKHFCQVWGDVGQAILARRSCVTA